MMQGIFIGFVISLSYLLVFIVGVAIGMYIQEQYGD